MRFTRLSFIAGWAAVALLAAAGFATFGTGDGSEREGQGDVGSSALGHTTGAYAGLAFAVNGASQVSLADDGSDSTAETETAEPSATDAVSGAPGTIAPDDDGWLSQVEVRILVAKYFKAADVNQAVRVAWCESRFDPDAVNLRTGAVGLFQHLPKYWPERADNAGFAGADPTDAEASTAAAAWEVYNGAGWDVFACRD